MCMSPCCDWRVLMLSILTVLTYHQSQPLLAVAFHAETASELRPDRITSLIANVKRECLHTVSCRNGSPKFHL